MTPIVAPWSVNEEKFAKFALMRQNLQSKQLAQGWQFFPDGGFLPRLFPAKAVPDSIAFIQHIGKRGFYTFVPQLTGVVCTIFQIICFKAVVITGNQCY